MTVSKLRNDSPRKRLRALLVAAPAALVLATLAGCTPAGTTDAGSTAAAEAGGAAAGDSAAGINIVVIGGASDDPFFSSVKRGVDDAAKVVEANGGKVTYLAMANYNNLGPDAAQLAKNALGQNPSAVAIPDWVPDAEDPAIKEIVAAGIPVLLYNAGDWESAEALGALTYIGTDEFLAGVAAGEALGEAGAKNVICVNTVPGATNLEDRCAGTAEGIEKSGGVSNQLALPASSFGNQTAVTQAIKSGLQNDASVDGVITVGGSDAESAAAAIEQAGATDRVKSVSFTLSPQVLDRIKAGTQLAAIDQQPYPQGYYTVSALFQYAAWGIELPTKPILTGPAVINADNVDLVIDGAAEGVR